MKKIKRIIFIVPFFLLLAAGCTNSNIITNKDTSTPQAEIPKPQTSVDLSYRLLSKVDPQIFNNTTTEELNLSHNNLTGALPAEIKKLKNLKKLDISYNRMTGLPAELGQLFNLESLDVSHNQLTGLPYELGNLKKLKTLNVSGNNYSVQDLEHIKIDLPNTTIITK